MIESILEADPNQHESSLARESGRVLVALLSERGAQSESISVRIGGDDEPHEVVTLPVSALRLMTQVLEQMARGNVVALMPVGREISTFEAADILNVSRPYLIKLLETGEIPFRRVGTHRRVSLRDLLEYKRADDTKRSARLDDLTAEAQELDMGY